MLYLTKFLNDSFPEMHTSKYNPIIKYSVVNNKIIFHRKSNMEDFTHNFNNENRFILLVQWFLNCDPQTPCTQNVSRSLQEICNHSYFVPIFL